MNRRTHLKTLVSTATATLFAESFATRLAAAEVALASATAGKINHAVCRWCYSTVTLDDLCVRGKAIGLQGIDLLKLAEVPTAQKYGLTCSMVDIDLNGYGIKKGFNRLEHHADLVAYYNAVIPQMAKMGLKNIICFSGNRAGLSDAQGLANCAIGLKKIMATAEKYNVNVVMELLNSKIDHADYQCDHSDWGVALAKSVDSERFGLLFDIYHMQIMEGDVIRSIRDHHVYFKHYHTGGVPGRNEIDETQELYYPAIMRAIVEVGHKGFVAQEFIPKAADKLGALERCVKICEV
jgi:hydroxypyruvate isomerase